MLPANWHACERGNTMLSTGEGNMVAWLTIDGDTRLEVSYAPDNYPSLNVRTCTLTDTQLAEHINTKLKGWAANKCNCPGVNLDERNCVKQEDT